MFLSWRGGGERQIQLVSVNDLQEIQPTARNVMDNFQKAYSHGVSYCLRPNWAFLEATFSGMS